VLINKQRSIRLKRHLERRPLKNIQIRVEILKNGKKPQPHMRFLETKIRESFTTRVAKKPSNKVQPVEVVVVTSSPKCSEEVEVVVVKEDHKKERVFNMPSKLLSKKSSRVRHRKLLLTETGFALVVQVREVKTALMLHAKSAREEVWLLL